MSDSLERGLVAAVEAIIGDRIRLAGLKHYRVLSQDGMTVDCEPVNASLGLPAVAAVPIRPSIPGSEFDIAPGTTCVLAFLDGDAAKPFIVAFDGTGPDEIRVGGGLGSVIRVGDTVSIAGTPPNAAMGVISVTVGLGLPPSPSKLKA